MPVGLGLRTSPSVHRTTVIAARRWCVVCSYLLSFFFLQAEDGIRDWSVTGVQTCALPIYCSFSPVGTLNGEATELRNTADLKHPSERFLWVEENDPRGENLGSWIMNAGSRSEERRVGKECRSRWSPYH